jgi:hypothetical protein
MVGLLRDLEASNPRFDATERTTRGIVLVPVRLAVCRLDERLRDLLARSWEVRLRRHGTEEYPSLDHPKNLPDNEAAKV